MIRILGSLIPPASRLIDVITRRGYPHETRAVGESQARPLELVTGVLSLGKDREDSWATLGDRAPAVDRLLILSWLGAHPDARAAQLRRLWELEEHARGTGKPVLTLRLAPMIGPESPLWLKLRSKPRLPRGGRHLLNPVAESDVIDTLERALSGQASWDGWYEVAGPETLSLAELRAMAEGSGPPLAPPAGSWEPPLAVLAAQRLSEAGPWLRHFGLEVRPLPELVLAWAA